MIKDPWRLAEIIISTLRRLFSLSHIRLVMKKGLKWGLIGGFVLATTIAAILLVATYVIEEDDINRNLSKWVKEASGADFHVKKTHLNLIDGITFTGVTLYPQDLNKWPNQKPLVTIEELNLHYDFLRIALFELKLKQAQIIGPTIYLTERDHHWNYQPILDFLAMSAANLPDPATKLTPIDAAATSTEEALRITDLLPIHPASVLIVPFKLNIDNIGFTDLKVIIDQVNQNDKGDIENKQTSFQGLSLITALHWVGTESKMTFRLSHTENTPLILKSEVWNPETKSFKAVIDAALELEQSISLTDLDRLAIKADINLKSYVGEGLKLADIPVHIDIRLALLDSLDGIKIDAAIIELLGILALDTTGTVKLLDGYLDQYQLNIDHNFNINLDKAGALLSQLKIPINTSGKISLKRLHIEGPLIPSKFSAELPEGSLPDINLQLNLENIEAKVPDAGVKLQPLNGVVKITSHSLAGEPGIQLELDSDLKISGVDVVQKIEKKTAVVNLRKFQNTISARLSYPSLVLPYFRLLADIESLKVKMGKEPPILIPLSLEFYGSVSENLNKISLDAKLDIEDLLDFGLDIRCKSQCNKFKINQNLQLESFAKLYPFVQPLLSKFMPLDLVPEFINGKLSIQTVLKGQSRDIKESDLNKILAQTTGHLGLNFNLENFSTKVPKNNISLKDLNTKVGLSGTFQKQFLDFKQTFSEAGLDIEEPPKNGALPKRVSIEHFSFDTKINNESKIQKGIANISDKLFTSLATNIYIGQVHLRGILPKPLKSIALKLEAEQSKLAKIQLSTLEFDAPDFGANLKLSGDTYLNKSYMPESFKLKTVVNVQHSGGEGLASGIKTSGSMLLNSEVSSEDLKIFKVSGKTSFDGFNLTIPSANPNIDHILLVDTVNGDIPLSQTIDLSPYLKLGLAIPVEPASKTLPAKVSRDATANQPITEKQQLTPEDSKASEASEAKEAALRQVPTVNAIEKYFTKTQSAMSPDTNLVGHVDYLSVKGFYPEHKTLTIKKISAANLIFNQLEFDIEVKQNWFSLSQFTIGFLGGKIQGDLRLAFSPMPEELKMSLHLTRLNTTKLIDNFPALKKKSESWDLFSDPFIDSNIHLHYDLKNNDMAGGIDITTIGKEQLKMMLFYLDPEENNPSLDSIKTALNFGDVSHVSIPIRNGMLGLDVGVTVLAIPVPLPKLQSFPIAQLISNFQMSSKPVKKEDDEKSTM